MAEDLDSTTSRRILRHLADKTKIAEAGQDALQRCKPYLPAEERADVVQAATTLETGAIRIPNDTDFDKIRKARIITVWSISEAIRRILF